MSLFFKNWIREVWSKCRIIVRMMKSLPVSTRSICEDAMTWIINNPCMCLHTIQLYIAAACIILSLTGYSKAVVNIFNVSISWQWGSTVLWKKVVIWISIILAKQAPCDVMLRKCYKNICQDIVNF